MRAGENSRGEVGRLPRPHVLVAPCACSSSRPGVNRPLPSVIPSRIFYMLAVLFEIDDHRGSDMTPFDRSRWLRIVQTGPFLRKWFGLGLDEDDLLTLELEIMKGPELYPIVKGTGGRSEGPVCSTGRRPGQERGLTGSVSPTFRDGAWSSC